MQPPVRRPVRLPVLTRPFGDLHRIATADLLHPDVEFAATIGTVGEETAVWRPSGPNLQSVVKSNAPERPLHR